MKKITYLLSLCLMAILGATSASAQMYYPTTRATSIEPGKQYMIYDASRDGNDRYAFRASNGSGGLKHTQTKPWDFITDDAAYIWTVEEIDADKTAANTYYLKTNANTYAGPGGKTDNAAGVEIMIDPWTTTSLAKSGGNCEAPDGTSVAASAVTAEMGLYVIGMGTNLWNGNNGGGSWAKWTDGHPYALYEVATIPAEVYTAYNNLKSIAATISTPDYYALQGAYGVDNVLTNYVCNKPETQVAGDNHPYTVLTDGSASSYFHSAYNNAGEDPHYMQVNMTNPVSDFYFYMAPRNSNNRPQNITISGSDAADGTFTEIAKVTGITMDNGYFSYKISSTTPYQYLRFTVDKTNTGTIFFTLSEFYVMPSNTDTDIAGFKNTDKFNPSINRTVTVADIEAQILNIGLTITKQDAKALLDANETNHAAVPALGQYATADYNALKAAYDACDDLEGVYALEEAMSNFKPNYAVFRINSNQSTYGVGKSVYDDGQASHHFKTKDVNEAQMLWEFSTTSTTITAGTYVVTNIATGRKFWDANNIVVYDNVTPATDGVFTFKTNGTGGEVHAQNASSVVVRWADQGATGGSAWTFEYVGDAYNLKNVVGVDYMNAVKTAAVNYNASSSFINDAIYGTTVGKFPVSSKQAIVDARTAYETTIGSKNAIEAHAAGVTLAQVQSVSNAFGTLVADLPWQMIMPEDGKAYKLYAEYKSGARQPLYFNGTRIAAKNEENITDANSMIFICRKVGDKYVFVNAGAGKYLIWCDDMNADKSVSVNGCTDVYEEKNQWIINSVATLGSGYIQHLDKMFLAGTGKDGVGYYLIPKYAGEDADCSFVSSGEYAWYYDDNGRSPLFTMEEVAYNYNTTTLKATDDAAYASFYSPFAVELPAGVEAYTGSVSGRYLAMTAVEGTVVPAGTGVILKSADAATHTLPAALVETAYEGEKGDLQGTISVVATPSNAYALSGASGTIGFFPYTAANLPRGKAYLTLDSAIQGLTMNFGGEATGIEGVEAENGTQTIFDLSGRKVSKAQKGLYIINGKKVLVK